MTCDDCSRSTSGRCWQHTYFVQVSPATTYTIRFWPYLIVNGTYPVLVPIR